MPYDYFNENLICSLDASNTNYAEWLTTFNRPEDDAWVSRLISEINTSYRGLDHTLLRNVLTYESCIEAAYKVFIIYVQEKQHENTQHFHATNAQYALLNFVEHIGNCIQGSSERLSSVVTTFICSSQDINTLIAAFKHDIIEQIAREYLQENPGYTGNEVHDKASFFIAANQIGFVVTNFSINVYNEPNYEKIAFLTSKLGSKLNPFKLISFIQEAMPSPDFSSDFLNKSKDLECYLKNLKISFDLHSLIKLEETFVVDKHYLVRVICDALCNLKVFKNHPTKPSTDVPEDIYFWYELFADKSNLHLAEVADKNALLQHYVRLGDIRNAQQLLSLGADINDQAPLLIAAHHNKIAMLNYLSQCAGIDLNARDHLGRTALLLACSNNHTEMALALIAAGLDLDCVDDDGDSALLYACNHRNYIILDALMSKHANLDTRNKSYESVLILAIAFNDLEMLVWCIKNGANVNICCKHGQSPLTLAICNQRTDMIEKLIKLSSINLEHKNTLGQNALILAVLENQLHTIKLLLEKGVNVNSQDNNNCTPLFAATITKNKDIFSMLLNAGADTKLCTINGSGPLHNAAKQGMINACKLMLKTNPDLNINHSDIFGETPLMCAIHFGHTSIANFLITNGANINLANVKGETPLMRAILKQNHRMANRLLNAGADVGMINGAGQSAVHYAICNGTTELMQKIIAKKPNLDFADSFGFTPLFIAMHNHKTCMAEILITHGADINNTNKNGLTPLMHAIALKNILLSKILLDAGADVNTTNFMGINALHFASKFDSVEIMQEILKKKPNIDQKHNNGRNALLIAIKFGNINSAQLLIAKGADIDICDSEGDTPLMVAIKNNNFDLIKLLLENYADIRISNNEGKNAKMLAEETGISTMFEECLLLIQAEKSRKRSLFQEDSTIEESNKRPSFQN